jgi:hypothetical protein
MRAQIRNLLLCTMWIAGMHTQAAVLSGYSDIPSAATIVDFDDPSFGFGTDIRNQYASLGIVFGGPSYPGINITNPNLPSYILGDRSPNALQVGPWSNSAGGAPLDIEFSVPATEVGFSYEVSNFANLELRAYNRSNLLIDDVIYTATAGFAGLRETESISHLDLISYDLRFGTPFIDFGIDTFDFAGATAPAPEPASGVLMGLAAILLLLCLAGQRRGRFGSRGKIFGRLSSAWGRDSSVEIPSTILQTDYHFPPITSD